MKKRSVRLNIVRANRLEVIDNDGSQLVAVCKTEEEAREYGPFKDGPNTPTDHLSQSGERTNAQRVSDAEDGLEAWLSAQGSKGAGSAEENLTDLLADLRHMAQAQGLDFDDCARISRMHFEQEGGKGPKVPGRAKAFQVVVECSAVVNASDVDQGRKTITKKEAEDVLYRWMEESLDDANARTTFHKSEPHD